MAAAAAAKVEYTAMLLGATGNVGGRILHPLVQSPLCSKVVVVTPRNVAELANPKMQQVVVNMDTLEEELAPHATGVDIALAGKVLDAPDQIFARAFVSEIARLQGRRASLHG